MTTRGVIFKTVEQVYAEQADESEEEANEWFWEETNVPVPVPNPDDTSPAEPIPGLPGRDLPI